MTLSAWQPEHIASTSGLPLPSGRVTFCASPAPAARGRMAKAAVMRYANVLVISRFLGFPCATRSPRRPGRRLSMTLNFAEVYPTVGHRRDLVVDVQVPQLRPVRAAVRREEILEAAELGDL